MGSVCDATAIFSSDDIMHLILARLAAVDASRVRPVVSLRACAVYLPR